MYKRYDSKRIVLQGGIIFSAIIIFIAISKTTTFLEKHNINPLNFFILVIAGILFLTIFWGIMKLRAPRISKRAWKNIPANDLPPNYTIGFELDKKENILFSEKLVLKDDFFKKELNGFFHLTDKKIVFNTATVSLVIPLNEVRSFYRNGEQLILERIGESKAIYFHADDAAKLYKLMDCYSDFSYRR